MFDHETVLKQELVDSLNLPVGSIAIDCTAGGGGHTHSLLKAVGSSGKVYAFDRDPMALEHLKKRFEQQIEAGQLILCQTAFSEVKEVCDRFDLTGKVSGICADIGVSSPQLDLAERGFSFMKDGPLDMRMDTTQEVSAYHVINSYSEEDLANIIWKYGEEPKSRFVARGIVEARQDQSIDTTLKLAKIVEDSIHYKTKSRKHPATKTFQALRIYVNKELEELETVCNDGFEVLRPGGRLSIITFHSLEDKFVKHFFNRLGKGEKIPNHLKRAPLTEEELSAIKNIKGRIIKPFPLIPSEDEQKSNVRSRSAKQRTIEKLGE